MSGVDRPEYYKVTNDGYDAGSIMEYAYTWQEQVGYWKGCCLKYAVRMGRKGNIKDWVNDAAKLAECAKRLQSLYEEQGNGKEA